MAHPHDVDWFEEHRPEVLDFTRQFEESIRENDMKHILVKAPVKSGKKDITECISVVLPDYRVKYVTSLNRKDVKSQKDELQQYGIATFVTDSDLVCNNTIRDIQNDITRNNKVILMFDESDHGSGKRQKLSIVFMHFRDDDRVVKVYVSASAHETEASRLANRTDFVCLTFIPPPSFRGAGWFLEQKLVFEPHTFFEKDGEDIVLTDHGKEVILDSITSTRHIGVVRVSSSKVKVSELKNKQIRKDLEMQLTNVDPDKKEWIIVPVDESSPFEWDNEVTQAGYIHIGKNVLIVIAQTCTRGTDLRGWHAKLGFWHDARRKQKSNLNTLIQALLRPSHYAGMSHGYCQDGERIRMYVDESVLQAVASDDVTDYIRAGGRAPTRTKSTKPKIDYKISDEVFSNTDDARSYAHLKGWTKTSQFNVNTDNNTFRYRDYDRVIESVEDTRNSSDLGYGVASAARIMPVYTSDNTIHYIVIYRSGGSQTTPFVRTTAASMYENT